MLSSYTEETKALIQQGRSITGKPYSKKLLGVKNFASLFSEKVKANSNKNFITYVNKEGETVNFRYIEFYEKVSKIANMLVEHYDISENDRVSSVAYNHIDTVSIMFACFMLGACYVPVNVGEDNERITFVHNNANVKVMFIMPEYEKRIESLKHNIETVQHYIAIHELDALIKNVSENFKYIDKATLDTEALIVYTSGTTGTPKGVLLQQYNLLIDACEISKWYGFNESSRAMLVLPIHHVNGIVVTLITPLYSGASVVLNEKFSASKYWQIVKEQKCTYGSVVPTILSFLCETNTGRDKLSDDYFLICGAGPLTVESAKKFDKTFGVKVNHGYGLSETTCYSCYLPFDLSRNDYESWMYEHGYPSIGTALPCNEMDIHDESGQTVSEGVRGEIVIRGHNVMNSYYKRPKANAEAFEFGWFKSGDEGFYKLDEQGRKFYFITGRLKELIIRGGVNYSPLEIDEVINNIDGVKAGMAVGFENNMYGEEVGAYVVLEECSNLTEDDVLIACEVLPFAKRPKIVVIGNDLPVTSTGKYQRNKLKILFAKWKNTQFKK